ncbi:MAG: BNR repeat-containing protein [Cyclobacteriaceae bacterium]
MNDKLWKYIGLIPMVCWIVIPLTGQDKIRLDREVDLVSIGYGWSRNSVNATIFRKNSIVSDDQFQYVAFYDTAQFLTLAKRKLKSRAFEVKQTAYQGNATDAHNSISIILDSEGFLHVAWDHHNGPLKYLRSVSPHSLELTEPMLMTGKNESRITYPEFYKIPNGDLLFMYRNGESGNGELVINRYNQSTKSWRTVQENLIDGQGDRNAYWQAYVDRFGVIHLSWVWRETWDVATNHDLCYAKSEDGGVTWEKSTEEKYVLPITVKSAELAWLIPQKSELVNQTSMTVDSKGSPLIATYWSPPDTNIPQIQLVYYDGNEWKKQTISKRTIPFSLSGGGTKRIPISRPQVIYQNLKRKEMIGVIFRDEDGKPVMLSSRDFPFSKWQQTTLANLDLGLWEPSYDTELWDRSQDLNLFIQRVDQIDGEGLSMIEREMVKILECKPFEN